jgi:hypothetical protein
MPHPPLLPTNDPSCQKNQPAHKNADRDKRNDHNVKGIELFAVLLRFTPRSQPNE